MLIKSLLHRYVLGKISRLVKADSNISAPRLHGEQVPKVLTSVVHLHIESTVHLYLNPHLGELSS